jgi:ubiquinone/menaquinone biosynthesis C-methylase UbiE
MSDDRRFYEQSYHFDEDIVVPGEERLWRAMQMLEPLAGTSFLDLGSGVGWAAQLAGQRGRADSVVGLDFAFRALKLGQDSVPGVHRVQGDGTKLPFRDASFHRALSFGSVEHFPDVVAGLRELARVMTTDGRAVVVVPNFYVRTEQPRELRLSYFGWRDRFTKAGLEIVSTAADRGPAILRDRRPARVAFRAGAKVLSFVPGLQYQFAFLLKQAGAQ